MVWEMSTLAEVLLVMYVYVNVFQCACQCFQYKSGPCQPLAGFGLKGEMYGRLFFWPMPLSYPVSFFPLFFDRRQEKKEGAANQVTTGLHPAPCCQIPPCVSASQGSRNTLPILCPFYSDVMCMLFTSRNAAHICSSINPTGAAMWLQSDVY